MFYSCRMDNLFEVKTITLLCFNYYISLMIKTRGGKMDELDGYVLDS